MPEKVLMPTASSDLGKISERDLKNLTTTGLWAFRVEKCGLRLQNVLLPMSRNGLGTMQLLLCHSGTQISFTNVLHAPDNPARDIGIPSIVLNDLQLMRRSAGGIT